EAYTRWWRATAQRVSALFANQVRPVQGNAGLNAQALEELFRIELNCNDLLPQLVAQKNNQLTLCVRQLNAAAAPAPRRAWPVEAGWIGKLAGRLLYDLEEQSLAELSVTDGRRLGMIFLWLLGHGLWWRLAVGFPLSQTNVARLCLERAAQTIPAAPSPAPNL